MAAGHSHKASARHEMNQDISRPFNAANICQRVQDEVVGPLKSHGLRCCFVRVKLHHLVHAQVINSTEPSMCTQQSRLHSRALLCIITIKL